MELLINTETINNNKLNILFAKIQSRHINSVIYSVIISYLPNINEASSITAWKCTCKVGNRKVGCCSHVATFIYY